MTLRSRFICICMLGLLSACGGGSADNNTNKNTPATERRISALTHSKTLTSSPLLDAFTPRFPAAKQNMSWPFQDITPFTHVALPETLSLSHHLDTPTPANTGTAVIAANSYFLLDDTGNVHAYDVSSNALLWRKSYSNGFSGGMLAYGDGQLVLVMREGKVMGIDPKSGNAFWQREIDDILISPPYIYQRHIYVTSLRHKTYALHGDSGNIIWLHQGGQQMTQTATPISPLGIGEFILVPYASGELVLLHAKSGDVLWRTALRDKRHLSASLISTGIQFTPLLYDTQLYAVTNSGTLNKIDLYNQTHIWTKDLGIITRPIASGKLLFALNNQLQLFALHTNSGDIKWVTDLSSALPAGSKILPPLFAGEYVRIITESGDIVNIQPATGAIAKQFTLPHRLHHAIVQNNRLYTAGKNGTYVYR